MTKSKSLSEQEASISKSLNKYAKIKRLPYKNGISDFSIPSSSNPKKQAFKISFGDINCPFKKVIFRSLRAAHYKIFFTDEYAKSNKGYFKHVGLFWSFVKFHPDFTIKKRVKILKEFEAFRVADDNISPQSAGLNQLRRLIKISLEFVKFTDNLTSMERDYLFAITEVKSAPSNEKKPINLNHWFSQHTWLRREDIGIGHAGYVKLVSPKALINSFRTLIETELDIVQTLKNVLITFFKKANFSTLKLPIVNNRDYFKTSNAYQAHIKECQRDFFLLISDNLHHGKKISGFNDAIRLLFLSNVGATYRAKMNTEAFHVPSAVNFISSHSIFHLHFLLSLVNYVEASNQSPISIPVCRAEEVLFSWLMASLTVQPTDIGKLRLSDFIFTRRADGEVRYVKCLYFKTRADSVHHLRTLSVSEDIGKVVLRYICDVTMLNDSKNPLVSKRYKNPLLSKQGSTARILEVFSIPSFHELLLRRLKNKKVTGVFYDAISVLLKVGVRKADRIRHELGEQETEMASNFFGLMHIKNSAVYAETDHYDPSSLINFNSHNNETERKHYLTKHNQEWINNCGRVTRAVLLDLIVNVFRPSQKDLTQFNTEFTRSLEYITNKNKESLASHKLVIEGKESKVDALGIYKKSSQFQDIDGYSIYVENSKWTVMKMEHYKKQVEQKHRALMKQAPIYLFSTVLPTLEWIEELLDGDYFSATCFKEGNELFSKFAGDLPPFFIAQLG
jgi:hypothetical protein